MAESETGTESKTTLYLAIACGVLVLILGVVAVIVMTSGGDPTIPGGAAAAAAAAAAEATRRRQAARKEVAETKETVTKLGDEIEKNQEDATTDIKAVPDEVANLDDEALGNEADNLFGGDDDADGSA